MVYTKFFAETLLWFIYAFHILGFLFQIRANHRLQSTQAVSFWLIWTYHLASTAGLIFVYLLWLPLPMRVMVPLEAIIVGTLIGQEIWFAPTTAFRRKVTLLHGAILIGTSCLWYAGLFHPRVVGHIAGWISVAVLSISQLPQIMRNWKRQSVVGLSCLYLTCSTISAILYLWTVHVLALPLPVYANSIRALLKRGVLWWQFFTYSRVKKS